MLKLDRLDLGVFLFASALLFTLIGCSKSDPEESSKPEKETSRVVSKVPLKYDHLDQFLTNAEQEKVEAVHRKYMQILEDWHAKHGEKIRSGRSAVVDFMKTKDKVKAKEAIRKAKQDNVKELILEEQKLQKEYDAAVLAAIPTDKLKTWQANKIGRTLLEFLKPLELTEEQVKQVHDLAPKAIQQIPAKDSSAWHVIGTTNLENLVGQSVIKPAQRTSFEELKKKNRLRKLKWAL